MRRGFGKWILVSPSSSSQLLTVSKTNTFSFHSLATQTIVGQIRQDCISLDLVPANKSCPVHSIPRCFVLISLWFWLGGMAGIVAPLFSFLLQTELENKGEGKVCGCFWPCAACLLGVVSHFRQKCGWPCSLCYLTLSLFSPYPIPLYTPWLIMQSVSLSNVRL